MEKKKPKTSKSQMAAVRRYDENAYDRITVRVPKGYREQLKEIVKPDSVNGFIIKAMDKALKGVNDLGIKELSVYAKSAGMTEEEYIKAAVIEKMQRQAADFKEDITRVKEVY